jgi:predicted transcriptional regulator
MDRKQKEALVLALLEKGKTYREIAREAGVSPNTIKAIANKAGIDESTSISSRAFELYVQQKSPVEVAITLNMEAKEAIRYHQEYFMLLGLTEFTRAYLEIKDYLWPFVNLVKLVLYSGLSNGEVVALLKIANGYLPRVRLEYDRLQAELNSLKAEINNSVRTYQDFCNRNLEMNKRINELQLIVDELEARRTKLKKTTTESNHHIAEFQESNAENDNLNLEMEQEVVRLINDLSRPPSNITINYHSEENDTLRS